MFLGYTATDNNVYIINNETSTVKTGQHVIFDEAHMMVPAGHAPLAAQMLQRLGYYVKETWVEEENKQTTVCANAGNFSFANLQKVPKYRVKAEMKLLVMIYTWTLHQLQLNQERSNSYQWA